MNAKRIAVLSLLCAAVALVGCRREQPYEPLKLGADVPAAQEPVR